MKAILLPLSFLIIPGISHAQIISPDTVCINELVTFTTPVRGNVFSWNFDTVNVSLPVPVATTAASGSPISSPSFVTMTNDNGNWYAFTGNYTSSEVIRLNFGNSPYNVPVVTSMGTFGRPTGQRLEGIDIVMDSATGNWYGFTVNYTPELMRLDFGNSLANTPTATVMPFGFTHLAWAHQLGVKKIGSEWIGFAANRVGGITRFDFGSSITNTPSAIMLPAVNYNSPCNFALYQQGANWHMLVTNLTGPSGYSRLDFGPNIQNNSPSVTNLGNPGSLMNLPRGINIFSGCGQLYAYVMNESGGLLKIDFQNNIMNAAPTVSSVGSFVTRANSFQPYIFNNDLNALVVGNNSIENMKMMTLPAGTINAYKTPAITHTFTTPGIYDITLFVDQGSNMGSSAFCKRVVVISGRNDLLGPDTALCGSAGYLLDAAQAGATGYTWNTGASTPSISVTQSGTYWVHVSGQVCGAADTVSVTFHVLPHVDLGADRAGCTGDVLTLRSSGGTYVNPAYAWSTGAATPAISVNSTGNYILKITDQGCAYADTVDVVINPKPIVNLGNDTNVCVSALPLTLRSTQPPGSNYLWSNGLSALEMDANHSGIYWLEITLGGCVTSDTILIEAVPDPSVYLGRDTIICEQFPLRIGAEVAGAGYAWNTGAATAHISVSATGTYILSVNLRGCVVSDTADITAMPVPEIDLGADRDICPEQTILLDATYTASSSYLWNTGATSATYAATSAGWYRVTVTSEHGCIGHDSILFSYYPKPVVSLGSDTSVCEETPLQLTPWQINADSLLWSDGTVNPVLSVRYGGNYIVTGINKCGTGSDTIVVRQIFCDIWLPNAFTPNNDGANDVFRVLGNTGRLEGFGLSIYNRWGQRVFHTQDKYQGWDGRQDGSDVMLGTYIYMMQYSLDGKPYVQKGNFHLIR